MGEQVASMHDTYIQYRYINYTDDIIEQKEHGKGYRKKIIIVGGKFFVSFDSQKLTLNFQPYLVC